MVRESECAPLAFTARPPVYLIEFAQNKSAPNSFKSERLLIQPLPPELLFSSDSDASLRGGVVYLRTASNFSG